MNKTNKPKAQSLRTPHTKSESVIQKEKPKWTKTKIYKLIGQLILLISFLAQNLVFEKYNEKLTGLSDSFKSQSMIDKGADLKELKFLVSELSPDTLIKNNYQEINIHEAAKKIAESQTMVIAGLDRPVNEKSILINNMFAEAYKVHNFTAYMNFINYVNNNAISQKEIENNMASVKDAKNNWFYVFILLYITGTVLLSLSVKYEV